MDSRHEPSITMKTPECDRWGKVVDDAKTIEEFMDFLSSKGYIICLSNEYGYFPKMVSNRQIVYDYFEIDSDKLEKERRELLEEVRSKRQLVKSVE